MSSFGGSWKAPNRRSDGTGGHKTAYLWEELLTRQSLTTIIEHFAIIPGDTRTPLAQKSLYFPRHHQPDVMRQLLTHVKTNGVGHIYLIQGFI